MRHIPAHFLSQHCWIRYCWQALQSAPSGYTHFCDVTLDAEFYSVFRPVEQVLPESFLTRSPAVNALRFPARSAEQRKTATGMGPAQFRYFEWLPQQPLGQQIQPVSDMRILERLWQRLEFYVRYRVKAAVPTNPHDPRGNEGRELRFMRMLIVDGEPYLIMASECRPFHSPDMCCWLHRVFTPCSLHSGLCFRFL